MHAAVTVVRLLGVASSGYLYVYVPRLLGKLLGYLRYLTYPCLSSSSYLTPYLQSINTCKTGPRLVSEAWHTE